MYRCYRTYDVDRRRGRMSINTATFSIISLPYRRMGQVAPTMTSEWTQLVARCTKKYDNR
jgi:hypothetical protein